MFASNHQQIFRPSSSSNNENSAVLPAKNTDAAAAGVVSKTPAASGKQRRALGDISNRKGRGLGNNNGNNGKGGVAVIKPQTPGSRLFTSTTKSNVKSSKKSESAVLPRQTLKHASSGLNILSVPKESVTHKTNKVTFVEEPVADIEKPAGRLWVDQLDYDEDDSEMSLSIPGAATLKEDWAAVDLARRKRKWQLLDEADQRAEEALDEMVAKQLQKDDEDDILGTNVWIERTLSFDMDIDDDLSWGAPSFCGEVSF